MTEQLAARARSEACAKAKEAQELEARAYREKEAVKWAVQEYNRLVQVFAKHREAFIARHGREPTKMRELNSSHRNAWNRRLELRKEFPGRPWNDTRSYEGSSSSAS